MTGVNPRQEEAVGTTASDVAVATPASGDPAATSAAIKEALDNLRFGWESFAVALGTREPEPLL